MKNKFSYIVCLLIIFVSLGGCETSPPSSGHNESAKQKNFQNDHIIPLPTPDTLPPYRLQIGDRLRIRLVLNPELDEDVIIRPDGMISTALVQNVLAYSKTPLELQKDLIHHYKSQLKNPKLSVIVQSFAPTRVYVMGEVHNPGEFISVESNPTILQAIARAGGILETANVETFLVIRRTPGQKEQIYRVNYKEAVTGRNLAQDIRLAAQDILIVPRSGIGNLYHYYRQYIQKFLPSSFGLGYNLNPDDN